MPDFIAGERDASLRGTEVGLSSGRPIHTHAGVPYQDFNGSLEAMKLVCHYDPAFPTGELSAPPGEETAS